MITHRPRLLCPVAIKAICLIVQALLIAGCASSAQKPVAVESSHQFAFWPPYPDEPHIQFLVSYQHSGQVTPSKKSALADIVYGKDSTVDTAINKPYGVEMWNGRIYTCDIRAAAVMVFDLRNKQTRMMGVSGSQTLVRPTDIAIADDGMKYVADLGRNVIFVFDSDERFVTLLGLKDLKPTGIAVYGDRVYVGNITGQCVEIFDRKTGEHLGRIGERGDEDGQFVRPLGVDVDLDGNVYVTDVIQCKIQKFSPEGEFLKSWGTVGNNLGSFVRPKHVAVDHDGNVYVVDSAFQNVQIFNSEGYLLTFFGAVGAHPGAMYLPVGIAVHYGDLDLFAPYVHPGFEPEYLILVTNQFSQNKVSVYAFGRLKPGHTPQDLLANRAEVPLGISDVASQKGGIGREVSPDDTPADVKP